MKSVSCFTSTINSKSKLMTTVLFGFITVHAQIAVAAPGTVSYVHPFPWAFAFIIDGNNATCTGSTQWFIRWDNSNANRYYSLVLAANVAGKKVNIITFACDASNLAIVTDLDMR